jgi:hypothetical protein
VLTRNDIFIFRGNSWSGQSRNANDFVAIDLTNVYVRPLITRIYDSFEKLSAIILCVIFCQGNVELKISDIAGVQTFFWLVDVSLES